jgi:CheY-like chemotaxis protein
LREKLGAGVVLIALTGWGQEELRSKTRDAGFDYHLTKPLADGELQSLLALASAQDDESVDYRS